MQGPTTSKRARLAALTAAFQTRFAISTRQRVLPLRSYENPESPVFVSVTRARVRPEHRAEFDALTRRIQAALEGRPGLISHSIRREVFGTQAWTLTSWASPEARERFAGDPLHREAMQASRHLLAEVQVRRLTLRWDELPLSWAKALSALEGDSGMSTAQSSHP